MIIKFKKPTPITGYLTTENPNPFYRVRDLWNYTLWKKEPSEDLVTQLMDDTNRLNMSYLAVSVNATLDFCDDFNEGDTKIYELFQTCKFTDNGLILENCFPLLSKDKQNISTNKLVTTISLVTEENNKRVKFTIQGTPDILFEEFVEIPKREKEAQYLSSFAFSLADIYDKCTVKNIPEAIFLHEVLREILYLLREYYLRESSTIPPCQLPLCLKKTYGDHTEISMITLTPISKWGKDTINIIKGN